MKAATALALLGGAAIGAGVTVWFVRKKLNPFAGVFGAGEAKRLPGEDSAVASAAAVHIRQIRRYAFAASQDRSPVVGLTHASYALILLDTLEEVAGRDAIARTGYDVKKIRAFITKLQDMHAEALQKCDPHLQAVLKVERGEKVQEPGFVVAGWGPAPRGA
jgi:hypothetical protein